MFDASKMIIKSSFIWNKTRTWAYRNDLFTAMGVVVAAGTVLEWPVPHV